MRGMKKASVIAVFLALFITGFSLVRAENTLIQGVVSPAPSVIAEPTKWELLSLMQKNLLQSGTYGATLSEDEINGLIDAGLSSFKMKWFIDQASVKLEDGYVDITMHMVRPFKSEVTARGVIEVDEGKAVLKLSSVYYGFFPMPASFVERIGNFVMKKKSVDEWFAVRRAHWDDITLKKGEASFKISVPEENN